MPSANIVVIMGNLTRDPELKHTQGGHAVCNFGLAINNKYSKNGQVHEEATFVDVTCWEKVAENVAQYLHKGSACHVEGRLRTESWEDRNTGSKRSRLIVVASRVSFLDPPSGRDSGVPPRREPAQRDSQAPAQPQTASDDIPF